MQIEITPAYLSSQGLSKTLPRRFWAKVNKTDSCWLWTGYKTKFGHGQMSRGVMGVVPSYIFAHRAGYILHVGPVPDGKQVHHNCPGGDNPACVNPSHLWIGTQAENMFDMIAKGRCKPNYNMGKGESHPLHKISREQVIAIREAVGTHRKIGIVYGIGPTQVGRIKRGESWVS